MLISKRHARRPLLLVAVLAAALAAAGPVGADAQGGGSNNVVLVTATADGSSLARSGVQTASVGSDTVESANLAEATSEGCTGCRAVAIAVQAVFTTRDASTIEPANAAVAANANCSSCASFAYAYQYVLTTGGPVYLSPDAQQRLTTLRQEFAAAAASGLPFDELSAKLDALAAEFKALIDTQLVSAGLPAAGTVVRRVSSAPAA